ncbi:hypothetical protein PZ740_06525 [Rhodospirillales bacterium YIM 152171]|uniref:Uncharacterized protein n=2 Tax=Marinimicrococcus flavescens TaxID=3031815 RepID=A0AAP3XQG0_9PROT|nr:hypothetical protein [Marinimicrococcus flavescens]
MKFFYQLSKKQEFFIEKASNFKDAQEGDKTMIDPRSGRVPPSATLRMASLAALSLLAFLLPAAPALACHEYVSPSDGQSGCGAYRRDRENGSYQSGSSSSGSSSSGSSDSSGSDAGSGSGGTDNACT